MWGMYISTQRPANWYKMSKLRPSNVHNIQITSHERSNDVVYQLGRVSYFESSTYDMLNVNFRKGRQLFHVCIFPINIFQIENKQTVLNPSSSVCKPLEDFAVLFEVCLSAWKIKKYIFSKKWKLLRKCFLTLYSQSGSLLGKKSVKSVLISVYN